VIVLPQIGSTERVERGVRLQLQIPAELTYFEGHFPDCALLPGVVQIGWAIELGRTHVPFAGTFRALSAVKFTRVIQPDTTAWLAMEYAREKRQLTFAYEVAEYVCSSGSILFDA
jgi:3-hydroxymyristoyl/3-hydroxydecanoyl-(acyl carrier protein) dehydratase